MSSNERQTDVYIRVNDIFDELSEENKRLNEELVFANNCLNVLNKFKSFLNEIYDKYKEVIDLEDKRESNQLEEEFNSVIKSREEINKTNVKNEIIESVCQKSNENIVNSSEDSNTMSCLSVQKQKQTTNLITVRKIGIIRVKPNVKPESKPDVWSAKCARTNATERPKLKPGPKNSMWTQIYKLDPKTQRYVCSYGECTSSFRTSRLFRSHYNRVHLMKRHFCCHFPNCNKKFKTRRHLKQHSIVHSEDKPFVCAINGCNYTTKLKQSLDKHLTTHSEERPSFKCSECEKTYVSPNGLQTHFKEVHSIEPEFKCRFNDCGQTFKKAYLLAYHRKVVHNCTEHMFTCEWPGCDFASKISTRFKDHQALHTGVKRHVCKWPGCGKRFRTQETKYRHTLIHKNEMRYTCDWPGCDYRANIPASVRQHKIWNHKK